MPGSLRMGAVGGTPGLSTRTSHAASCVTVWPPVSTTAPSARTSAAACSTSVDVPASDTNTSWPRALARRAAVVPLRASPRMPTRMPLPDLQRAERDQAEQQPEDPEPYDDLALRPARLLEMMMQRRHQEQSLAAAARAHRVLEPRNLRHH